MAASARNVNMREEVGMSEPILNVGYTDVDGTGQASAYAHHLDRMTASEQVRGSKQRTFQAVSYTHLTLPTN